jgi:hypothetical protein
MRRKEVWKQPGTLKTHQNFHDDPDVWSSSSNRYADDFQTFTELYIAKDRMLRLGTERVKNFICALQEQAHDKQFKKYYNRRGNTRSYIPVSYGTQRSKV